MVNGGDQLAIEILAFDGGRVFGFSHDGLYAKRFGNRLQIDFLALVLEGRTSGDDL